MAAKKRGKAGDRRWQADANDAIRLAALRWFTLEMDRMSIEIYSTDKARFAAMERLFRGTLRKMADLRERVAMAVEEGCPDGQVRCRDGLCAPMCYDVE